MNMMQPSFRCSVPGVVHRFGWAVRQERRGSWHRTSGGSAASWEGGWARQRPAPPWRRGVQRGGFAAPAARKPPQAALVGCKPSTMGVADPPFKVGLWVWGGFFSVFGVGSARQRR